MAEARGDEVTETEPCSEAHLGQDDRRSEENPRLAQLEKFKLM